MTLLGAFLLMAVAALVAALTGAMVAAIHMGLHGVSFEAAQVALGRDMLLIALCQLMGLVTATGVGVLATFGDDVNYREALAVHAVPAALVVLALTGGFALQFPLHELANLLGDLVPGFAIDPARGAAIRDMVRIDGWLDAVTIPLAVVAIPAVSEELFFRGLLLPGFDRKYGPRVALVGSSLAFGLIHVMPVAVVYASLAGLVIGWVRQRTGSVLPCIALHGAFNAVPVVLPASLVRIEGFNVSTSSAAHLPLSLVLGSMVIAGISLTLLGWLAAEED